MWDMIATDTQDDCCVWMNEWMVFGFEPFRAQCTWALGHTLCTPCYITKLEEPCPFWLLYNFTPLSSIILLTSWWSHRWWRNFPCFMKHKFVLSCCHSVGYWPDFLKSTVMLSSHLYLYLRSFLSAVRFSRYNAQRILISHIVCTSWKLYPSEHQNYKIQRRVQSFGSSLFDFLQPAFTCCPFTPNILFSAMAIDWHQTSLKRRDRALHLHWNK
jgi:hypothetical protein